MGLPRITAGNARGMSLIELLVGLTILGLVALGATFFLGRSINQNERSLQRSIAASLAASRLHRLASMSYQSESDYTNYSLPNEQSSAGPPQTLTAAQGQIPGHPALSRTVTLAYNQPAPGMLTARVDVTWHHHGSQQSLHSATAFLHSGLELVD